MPFLHPHLRLSLLFYVSVRRGALHFDLAFVVISILCFGLTGVSATNKTHVPSFSLSLSLSFAFVFTPPRSFPFSPTPGAFPLNTLDMHTSRFITRFFVVRAAARAFASCSCS
jgi:hypothetical protein